MAATFVASSQSLHLILFSERLLDNLFHLCLDAIVETDEVLYQLAVSIKNKGLRNPVIALHVEPGHFRLRDSVLVRHAEFLHESWNQIAVIVTPDIQTDNLKT